MVIAVASNALASAFNPAPKIDVSRAAILHMEDATPPEISSDGTPPTVGGQPGTAQRGRVGMDAERNMVTIMDDLGDGDELLARGRSKPSAWHWAKFGKLLRAEFATAIDELGAEIGHCAASWKFSAASSRETSRRLANAMWQPNNEFTLDAMAVANAVLHAGRGDPTTRALGLLLFASLLVDGDPVGKTALATAMLAFARELDQRLGGEFEVRWN